MKPIYKWNLINKINKASKIQPETKQTVIREERGEGQCGGTSRTYMKDTWTKTRGLCLRVRDGDGWGEGAWWGENGDNCT